MELYAKLAKAQASMKQPGFDGYNPHFKSKFATLGEIVSVILPPLEEQGLFLSQQIVAVGDSSIAHVVTIVSDDQNAIELGRFPIKLDGDIQKAGSAITYAKRYSLASAFARVADMDDDGESAQEVDFSKLPAAIENSCKVLYGDEWEKHLDAEKKNVWKKVKGKTQAEVDEIVASLMAVEVEVTS